jgi:hypothetical protein
VLRGLDADAAARSDYEPAVVRVAGREPLPATVTVYVHERPSRDCYRRFEGALARLEVLSDADLLRAVRAVRWPADGDADPDATAAARSVVESFRQAAGRDALEPFYDVWGGGMTVPALAVAIRRSGTVTDLYPRRSPDGVHTVETGIERLLSGEHLETLAGADDGVKGRQVGARDAPRTRAATGDRPTPGSGPGDGETAGPAVGPDGSGDATAPPGAADRQRFTPR